MKYNRLMKIVASALACALLAVGTAACSGGNSGKQPDPEQLAADIQASGTYSDMVAVEADRLDDFYDLDAESIETFSLYICGSGGFPDEVAIFKMKDDSGAAAAKTAVEARVETLKGEFENYRPEQMPKLDNSEVLTQGRYVALIIGSDAAAGAQVFKNSFK